MLRAEKSHDRAAQGIRGYVMGKIRAKRPVDNRHRLFSTELLRKYLRRPPLEVLRGDLFTMATPPRGCLSSRKRGGGAREETSLHGRGPMVQDLGILKYLCPGIGESEMSTVHLRVHHRR